MQKTLLVFVCIFAAAVPFQTLETIREWKLISKRAKERGFLSYIQTKAGEKTDTQA